jgi:hypothetical protein
MDIYYRGNPIKIYRTVSRHTEYLYSILIHSIHAHAEVVKLVDTTDLKSVGPLSVRAGSSPALGTTFKLIF